MDERAIRVDGARTPAFVLAVGSGRYRIVSQDRDACVIVAPEGVRLRGYADIYEGTAHRARCLIVLAAPEGEFIRLTYKHCTPIRSGPAPDYAPGQD